jgi:hypothetical protein
VEDRGHTVDDEELDSSLGERPKRPGQIDRCPLPSGTAVGGAGEVVRGGIDAALRLTGERDLAFPQEEDGQGRDRVRQVRRPVIVRVAGIVALPRSPAAEDGVEERDRIGDVHPPVPVAAPPYEPGEAGEPGQVGVVEDEVRRVAVAVQVPALRRLVDGEEEAVPTMTTVLRASGRTALGESRVATSSARR